MCLGREKAEQRKEKVFPAESKPGKLSCRAIAVGTTWTSQRWLQYLPITNIPSTVAVTADGATAAWRPWGGATSGHCGKGNMSLQKSSQHRNCNQRVTRSPPGKTCKKIQPVKRDDLMVLMSPQECPGMEQGGWSSTVLPPSMQGCKQDPAALLTATSSFKSWNRSVLNSAD